MIVFSNQKDINKYVKRLLKHRPWVFVRRSSHVILKHESGRTLPVPFSPSDRRAFLNFKQAVLAIDPH